MHPLAELTNRTPSPSQKEEIYAARKHSPWTAARQKKKTRSFQPVSVTATLDHQEPIPEDGSSPEGNPSLERSNTQYSLAVHLCQPTGEQEVHATPTLLASSPSNTGSVSSAEVHSEPRSMDLGSGGMSLAAAAAADAHDKASKQASKSPPRGGNLFDKFGEVAHHHQQHLQAAPAHDQELDRQQHFPPQQHQEHHACMEGPCTAAAQCRTRPDTNQSGSRDTAGSCSRQWQLQHGNTRPSCPAAAASMQCSRTQYALHSRFAHDTDDTQQRNSCSNSLHTGCLLLQPQIVKDSSSWAAHSLTGTCEFGSNAILGEEGCSTDSALQWLEVQMQQAADQGDMPAARQLWERMQAVDLQPSRTFMHYYLLCCQYGAVDPVEAQEAVRDMCMAADMQPDGFTAHLLAAIDIGWQQLQWTV